MNLYEDFGDAPSVEERMPFGISPEEMRETALEAEYGECFFCSRKAPLNDLVETGMDEYLTMDIDPLTLACADCLEDHRLGCIPDNPSLYDCLTPLQSY